jgi:hypothetical protein
MKHYLIALALALATSAPRASNWFHDLAATDQAKPQQQTLCANLRRSDLES